MGKIHKISPEVKERIRKKGASHLPDNPGASGYKPADIKRALSAPITDDTDSVIEEVNRIVEDINGIVLGEFDKTDVFGSYTTDGTLRGESATSDLDGIGD